MIGTTRNYGITTNGPTNLAVNRHDLPQNLTAEQEICKMLEVADALARYVAAVLANTEQAREVAAGLRSEVPHGWWARGQ